MKSMVSSLHCNHGTLACAGKTTVSIYDSSQGTLSKMSVSQPVYCACVCALSDDLLSPLPLSPSPPPLQSYSPVHSFYSSLTCVYHNLGMVATASKDSTVAIHSPAPGHAHIATLQHHKSDITGLDCAHNMLAVASSDRNVTLWMPHHLAGH